MATRPAARSEAARTIEDALRRYGAAAARMDQEAADEAGLTLSTCEANFVNLLRLHGPLSAGRLGELTKVSSSGTTTGVIDRLEDAGYVERERCARDRRKVIVTLNAERLADEDEARSRRLGDVLAGYDDGQLSVIADFLARLADVETRAATPDE